ncbi:hypothetical protein [Salegentibacter flavus]|uniref:HNH endonuclease n=1 Tax=Salegentibacter flavus TaxID=287099 RepID=A0A1I4ZUW1_9FLAO|nr:hypothetical protein [Salegentibacter flavus]SFN54024.1 hypothetical protein SAMN05660413_01543 [Salegentibacter flavus]
MKNCKLCKKNTADKTGSHIVPHFLMKRIINEVGTRERDKELGFKITPETTGSFFGKAVLPEKLEEIYGEVTDELIEKNDIEDIVDNYFCTSCEKRFSVIENKYAKTLEKSTKIDQNYISEKRPLLGFLFWSSIVWRLSVQNNSGFKLKIKEENKLRRILDKYLAIKTQDLQPKLSDPDLANIGYKIIRSPYFSDKYSTWLHWSPEFQRPYSFIIDEYLVFFYFKKTHLNGMVQNFYDSEKFKKNAIFNTPFCEETVYGIAHDNYNVICKRLAHFAASKRNEYLRFSLDIVHQKLSGNREQMPSRYKEEIMRRIANSEEKLGRKGTTEEFIKITKDTITELSINT